MLRGLSNYLLWAKTPGGGVGGEGVVGPARGARDSPATLFLAEQLRQVRALRCIDDGDGRLICFCSGLPRAHGCPQGWKGGS